MLHSAVVCPFCPLLCDDLIVEAKDDRLALRSGGCATAAARLAQLPADATARVHGQVRPLAEALDHAAALLKRARLPLISGLGCDVDGMRAVLRLAEGLGAIVDHGAGDGLFANLLAMQRHGWVTATLAEVRNRADLLLFFGTDGGPLASGSDRRAFPNSAGFLSGPAVARRRIFLGDGPVPADVGLTIPWPAGELHRAAALLRARLAGRPVADTPGLAAIDQLADALREARYAAILWDAAALPPTIAEPTVTTLSGLLLELNRVTRAVGLPLARFHHVVTANQVCTWQWGVPLRSAATPAGPEHDPAAFATTRLLQRGDVDALVWISAFGDLPPPATQVPTVLLSSATDASTQAEVVLPVAIPGIDHAGTAFRLDSVVALPLRQLRQSRAPAVSAVLDAIGERLGERA